MANNERLCVAVTGDLQVDRSLVQTGTDPTREETQKVYDLLRQSDITFANLEVPLTDRGIPTDKLVAFRAPPEVADGLAQIGVSVVTVANNHALDYGVEGFVQTLDVLDAVGMRRVGGGRSLEEALAPAVMPSGAVKVAFVGLAATLPAGSAARPDRPGIAPVRVFTNYVVDTEALDEQPGTAPYVQTQLIQADLDQACEAVRRAAASAEIVIVGIHWGVPHGWVATFQDPIAGYQRPLAHALIDAGATAVIGNHAHVLHPIEFYQGRPILYCLGNFIFHRLAAGSPVALRREFPPYSWKSLRSPINRQSCVARLHFAGSSVTGVELRPIQINDRGEPELANAAETEEILARLAEMSRPYGTRIRRETGFGYAEPERSER